MRRNEIADLIMRMLDRNPETRPALRASADVLTRIRADAAVVG